MDMEAACIKANKTCNGYEAVENHFFKCRPLPKEKGEPEGPDRILYVRKCPGPCLYLGLPDTDYCPTKW
jgi:hypothetical protein